MLIIMCDSKVLVLGNKKVDNSFHYQMRECLEKKEFGKGVRNNLVEKKIDNVGGKEDYGRHQSLYKIRENIFSRE